MAMRGSVFVVSAPSGAGKTSLVNALVKKRRNVRLVVSHTTRSPRAGEINGKDYYFVGSDKFMQMRDEGAFLELANVFGNFYATSSKTVRANLEKGLDVILEIDWQGANQVREYFPDCVTIFMLPPSKPTLQQRLRGRSENEKEITHRMKDVELEMRHYIEFDYLVVNESFERTLDTLIAIMTAHEHSIAIQERKQADLLKSLLV